MRKWIYVCAVAALLLTPPAHAAPNEPTIAWFDVARIWQNVWQGFEHLVEAGHPVVDPVGQDDVAGESGSDSASPQPEEDDLEAGHPVVDPVG